MKVTAMMLMLACATNVVWAAEEPAQQTVSQDSLQILVEQQNDLRTQLDSGQLDGLTPRQVKLVSKAQTEFFKVTEGKQSLDQLSIGEKIRIENALERINAEVQGTRTASDDRNVCWRERVSGTTVKKTRCGTEAQMREAREGARDFMEKPKICVPPGCGA